MITYTYGTVNEALAVSRPAGQDRQLGLPPLSAARGSEPSCRGCGHPLDWHCQDRAIDPSCQIMDTAIGSYIYATGMRFDRYELCDCEGYDGL